MRPGRRLHVQSRRDEGRGKVAFARAPVQKTANGAQWLWSWALAVPVSSPHAKPAKRSSSGRPRRTISGSSPRPKAGRPPLPAPASRLMRTPNTSRPRLCARRSRPSRRPIRLTRRRPVPYTGIQYVAIPEFQGIGTNVGQLVAAALAGTTVEQALRRPTGRRTDHAPGRLHQVVTASPLPGRARPPRPAAKAAGGGALGRSSAVLGLLLLWVVVPLVMTLWFSFERYNLLNPGAGLRRFRKLHSSLEPTRGWARRCSTRSSWSDGCW